MKKVNHISHTSHSKIGKQAILLSHSLISSFSYFLILSFSYFLISCSETKNLAEDEILYVGIKSVDYDRLPKQKKEKRDTTGVITALGNAYNTVEGYLRGEKSDVRGERNDFSGEWRVESGERNVLDLQNNTQGENLSSLHAPLSTLYPDNPKLDREAYATAKSEVEGVLSYAPNNSLMGSSYYRQPLAVGLWTYNKYVYAKHRFGKWMFNTFAATPIYLTTVNPRIRAKVAQNTLRNYGYFRGQVSYDTIPQRNPRKSKISYQVRTGPLFHIDSIAYLGFPEQADSIIRATMRWSKLHRGDPFSVPALSEERTRLSEEFRNNGYYYFRPEYIVYRADTVARPGYVQLQVVPSPEIPEEARKQYNMGRTQINIYEYGADSLVDTIGRRNVRMAYSGKVGRPPLKMRAIRRFLGHRRGNLYSLAEQTAMQNNLTSMGIFSQVNVKYVGRSGERNGKNSGEWRVESGERNGNNSGEKREERGERNVLEMQNNTQEENVSSLHSPLSTLHQEDLSTLPPGNDTLDVLITLRLDKPYDAEFKGNIATKSNGLVGPGLSFSMSKQNVFRGAETLMFDAYGSYEWMTGAQMKGKSSVMNSFEYGTSLNLIYPRLLLFGLGHHFNRRAKATTAYKINADWLNRSGYFSRVSFGARVTHTYQRRPDIMHEVVPLRLDYEKQLHTTTKFDSIITTNQALYASLRNQFVPSAQYAISLTNPNSKYHKRRITLTLKEAGNLTSVGYRIAGKPFSQKDKDLFGVPFAQFLKLTAEYTHDYRIGHTRTSLAGRIFAGVVYSYGNATTAPYADLFTVGGANSIRAFGVRSIGPGSYNPRNSNYSYIDEMGNLKLEANLEYRFPLVSNLYGAAFVDAGNVWLTKPDSERPGGSINLRTFGREIALGTGIGLRYDLQFLVIRFDVGVGIHAPYDTGRRGYYNMTRFWDSLGFHLAVGYPF